MVAEQAARIVSAESEKNIIVIHSKSVPQGISSLYAFDELSDEKTNAENMANALSDVCSLSVTYAARDAVVDNMQIKKGQYLGLVENKVTKVTDTILECIGYLTEQLKDMNCVRVFYGEDVTSEELNAVKAELTKLLGEEVDLTVVSGGQPVYSYIISGEKE